MVSDSISKRTQRKFKKSMQRVIKGLSREVKVYKKPSKSQCPNCFFDSSTNSSTGKCKWTALEARNKQEEYENETGNTDTKYKFFKVGRCPVCKGLGYLTTDRYDWVYCLVIWNPGNRNNDSVYTPAGIESSTLVELKTDPSYYGMFKDSEKIIVDDIECRLAKPPILRGLGNDSVLVINAFTTDKLDTAKSTDVLKDYTGD